MPSHLFVPSPRPCSCLPKLANSRAVNGLSLLPSCLGSPFRTSLRREHSSESSFPPLSLSHSQSLVLVLDPSHRSSSGRGLVAWAWAWAFLAWQQRRRKSTVACSHARHVTTSPIASLSTLLPHSAMLAPYPNQHSTLASRTQSGPSLPLSTNIFLVPSFPFCYPFISLLVSQGPPVFRPARRHCTPPPGTSVTDRRSARTHVPSPVPQALLQVSWSRAQRPALAPAPAPAPAAVPTVRIVGCRS